LRQQQQMFWLLSIWAIALAALCLAAMLYARGQAA
jgi:hypothetical protein